MVASPLERAQETAAPIAARLGLPVDTDDDLIESTNIFQGQRVSPGDGALRDPRNWWHLRNPRTPSWGEPYEEIAARMTAALHRARIKAAGHEAVCVSHQLPVETLRRAMTDQPAAPLPDSTAVQPGLADVLLLPRRLLRRLGLLRSWPGSEAAGGSLASAAMVALAGCSTGDDAVAQGGTFEFVAPGGKTDIFYDPPESRGRPGQLAGPELMDPAKTISLDDFAGKVVVINVWGQWCGPCRTEITQLQKVYDATRGRRRCVPRHRRPRQQPRRRERFHHRPQGHVPVDLRPADAHHDRLRRQIPDHRHPVHRRAGPRAPGGRGVPARTARRGSAAGRGTAGGRTGADRHDLGRVDRDRPPAGPLLLALGVCVLAGLVSFASPCVVPLVPGYLSYLAAVVGVEERPAAELGHVAVARPRGCGSPVRRCCSSPASPRCSCSAPSRCWA